MHILRDIPEAALGNSHPLSQKAMQTTKTQIQLQKCTAQCDEHKSNKNPPQEGNHSECVLRSLHDGR